MFSLQRFTQCGVVLAALTSFSNIAAAMPISTFQITGGGLVVDAGGGGSPAELSFVIDFSILSQDGGLGGALVGLAGEITGTYEFDDPLGASIVAISSPTAPNSFIIDDGTDIFTANVDLISLQEGGGTIFGAIDFSSSSYTGTNLGLVELNTLIENTPNLTITFQTIGGGDINLDNLFNNGSGGIIAYSGVVNVTPIAEPTPLALLGLGLLCSAAYASRRRSRFKG